MVFWPIRQLPTAEPIDDLILWGVAARGRAYMRELRAFAEIVADSLGDSRDRELSDGALAIGGHLMSAETARMIGELRLDELALLRRHTAECCCWGVTRTESIVSSSRI